MVVSSTGAAAGSITKWAVTLRAAPESAEPVASFSDWVPVAILALECGDEADPTLLMPQAVGATCREIYEASAPCRGGPTRAAPRPLPTPTLERPPSCHAGSLLFC